MAKKSIIIIITAVTLSLVLAFGGAAYFYYISNKEKAGQEEVPVGNQEIEIDYKKAKTFAIEEITVKLKQTDSKAVYLKTKVVITVKDEKALVELEELADIIKDAILGVFETKSSQELDGNRNSMKEPILAAVREIFPKQEDKEKILSISIPEFFIQ